jgi:hypothetical protein
MFQSGMACLSFGKLGTIKIPLCVLIQYNKNVDIYFIPKLFDPAIF